MYVGRLRLDCSAQGRDGVEDFGCMGNSVVTPQSSGPTSLIVGSPGQYGVMVLLLVLTGVVAYTLATMRGSLLPTVQVDNPLSARLDDVVPAMIDQETGLRDYFLTGNRQFLEPYCAGRRTISPAVALAVRDVDTPTRLRDFVQLRSHALGHFWTIAKGDEFE